jgi:hypothetical protein
MNSEPSAFPVITLVLVLGAHEDRGKLPSEKLKSFHVDLDSRCKGVVDELGYQR